MRRVFGNKTGASRVQPSMEISRWQRRLGQGLMAAPGAWLAFEGIFRARSASEVFFGASVVGGAVLLGRRGVVAQVLGRGAAWAVAGPCLLGTVIALALDHSEPPPELIAATVTASAALLLTRSMLETREAKAAFAPLSARRWLLLASTAAVAAALAVGTLSIELAGRGWPGMPACVQWLGLPLLAVTLVASAIGVARMRAWGILLGALTSVLALAVGAAAHDRFLGLVLATTGLPGAAMGAAILAARSRAATSGAAMRIKGNAEAIDGRTLAEPPQRFFAAKSFVEADCDLDPSDLEPARAVPVRRV